MAGDEFRPLSQLGGLVYRVLDPKIQTPGHAFA